MLYEKHSNILQDLMKQMCFIHYIKYLEKFSDQIYNKIHYNSY